MALQTKTILGSANNDLWTWKMVITENSINEDDNTSSITITSYLGRASSDSYFGGAANLNITCNGESRDTSKTFTTPTNVSAGGWVEVQTETFTVQHDEDGLKNISVSSSLSTSDFTPTYASASGDMDLTTIDMGIIRIAVNGTYKKAKAYIGVNGVWKKCKTYLGVNGTWKKGI